jgi:oxygen-independent coproporphyrinogen-3 oxidase
VLRYVEAVEQRTSPIVEQHELTDVDLRAEALFLGMRMMRGVDLREYSKTFGVDLRAEHRDDLDRFREAGLLEFDGDLIRLTRNGALMSNEVFAAFV